MTYDEIRRALNRMARWKHAPAARLHALRLLARMRRADKRWAREQAPDPGDILPDLDDAPQAARALDALEAGAARSVRRATAAARGPRRGRGDYRRLFENLFTFLGDELNIDPAELAGGFDETDDPQRNNADRRARSGGRPIGPAARR